LNIELDLLFGIKFLTLVFLKYNTTICIDEYIYVYIIIEFNNLGIKPLVQSLTYTYIKITQACV